MSSSFVDKVSSSSDVNLEKHRSINVKMNTMPLGLALKDFKHVTNFLYPAVKQVKWFESADRFRCGGDH